MADISKKYLGPTLFEENKQRTWRDELVGQPEYEQPNKTCYKEVIVRFSTKEDFEDFQRRLEQTMSEKTKSIWHPNLDRSLAFDFDLLCVDENEVEKWENKPLMKDEK